METPLQSRIPSWKLLILICLLRGHGAQAHPTSCCPNIPVRALERAAVRHEQTAPLTPAAADTKVPAIRTRYPWRRPRLRATRRSAQSPWRDHHTEMVSQVPIFPEGTLEGIW